MFGPKSKAIKIFWIVMGSFVILSMAASSLIYLVY